MIKKSLLAGVGLMLLAGFFFGGDAWSYMATGVGRVQDSVRDSVPMEFEIERARKMARDLRPVINENRARIAREEVEVDRLERRIVSFEKKLDQDRGEILILKKDVVAGLPVSYGGRKFSIADVKVDLGRRFERYQTSEATLTNLRKMQSVRQKTLDAARRKLEGMLASKQQLEVEIEQLEAQFQMVQAAEATNQYHFDDSQLSRLKQLVSDVQARLETRQKLADLETDAYPEIPVRQPTSGDIVDQVTRYFETDTAQFANN